MAAAVELLLVWREADELGRLSSSSSLRRSRQHAQRSSITPCRTGEQDTR